MVVVNVKGKEIYLDGYIKKNIDFARERVLKHKDMMVIIVDGRVGGGKSTLTSQLAYYISDGNLSLDNITFDLESFEIQLKKANKGDCIILDEAFMLNKRTTQSHINMQMLGLLQQMRCKQVFIFIVLPFVYDLDKNLILGLCNLFLHCYREDFGPRGQYNCYDRHRLKNLWLWARQSYSYPSKVAKPNFRGKFTKRFPLDMEAYELKKTKCLERMRKNIQEVSNHFKIERDKAIVKLAENLTTKEICEVIGLKKTSVYDVLKLAKENAARTTQKE